MTRSSPQHATLGLGLEAPRGRSCLRWLAALLALAFALIPPRVGAQERGHGVSVWPLSGTDIVTEPGQIVSVSFRLDGHSAKTSRFIDRLELPQGWMPVTPTGPVDVLDGASLTRVVAFIVPSNAPAGVYEVVYGVQGQALPDLQDLEPIRVEVQRLAQLDLITERSPGFTVAGEVATAALRLVNRGNGPARVTLTAQADDGVRVHLSPDEVELPIRGQQVIDVAIDTPRDAHRSQQYVVKIFARDEARPDAARALILVESVPRGDARPHLYRSIPTHLSLSVMGEDDREGYQAEWYGTGFVDAKQTRSVDFMLRGPDTADITTAFGRREEYRLRYQGQDAQILVGDHSYRLSWLTEAASFGRGLGFTVTPGPLDVGAFHAVERFGQDKGAELGAHAGVDLPDLGMLRVNALLREELAYDLGTLSDGVFSLEGEARPGQDHSIHGEIAASAPLDGGDPTGFAWRLQAQGKTGPRFSYDAQKTRASQGFTGYFKDTDLLRLMATVGLTDHLRLRLSYRDDKDNVALDPARGSAMATRALDVAAVCAIMDGWCFDGGNHATYAYDRLAVRATTWEESVSGRALYGAEALRFTLQATGGARGDEDGPAALARLQAMASLQPQPGRQVALTGRWAWDSRDHESALLATKSLTVQGRWQLLDPLALDVQYRLTGTSKLDSQAQLGLRWQVARKWEATAAGRYESPRADGEALWAAKIGLSRTIDLPVAPRTDVGAVRGRLVDESVAGQPGIPGVVVRAGGSVAVTDDAGRFSLIGLPPGTHHIYVDNQTLGADRLLIGGQGRPVEVHGGRTSHVNLASERGAEVRGEILLAAEVAGSLHTLPGQLYLAGPAALGEEDEIAVSGVVIELSNGKETVRRVTDEAGRFLIQGLTPGRWTLTIHEEDLPEHHKADTPVRQLDLEAGVEEAVLIAVRPRMRRVQMMESGAPSTLTLE